MKFVADSHAVFWFVRGSDQLSTSAAQALSEAERTDGIVVSVATLVDLWYVTQTTRGVSSGDLGRFRTKLESSAKYMLEPIGIRITDISTSISRKSLADPWDRFIVATAKALDLPLVNRDRAIQKAGLVETIW